MYMKGEEAPAGSGELRAVASDIANHERMWKVRERQWQVCQMRDTRRDAPRK